MAQSLPSAKTQKPALWLAALAVALLGVGVARRSRGGLTPPGVVQRSFVHSGLERRYLLFSPKNASGRRPLVVLLHGGGGNARQVQDHTGFNALARREGLYVVTPNGTGRWAGNLLTFNAGRCCAWARDHAVDDSGFIAALARSLVKELPVDPKRIYATGMSNGGMMSYRLACEHADLFAAVAPVAGSLALDGCAPKAPVSVIAFHGTADQHVPFHGGVGPKGISKDVRLSQTASLAPFLNINACAATPKEARQGNISRRTWTCQRGGVAHVAITGGTHAWPGGQPGWAGGDKPTQEISANEAMWEFFKMHPKR